MQPPSLNQISIKAPQAGWSAIMVAMPNPVSAISSTQTKTKEKQKAYSQLKIEILQATIKQIPAKDKNSIYLLLHGHNFELFDPSILHKIQGVILLNLIDKKQHRIVDSFTNLNLPVLEIASNKLTDLTIDELKRRNNFAKLAGIHYRQIIYPAADLNFGYMELILTRTITGWLNKPESD